MAFNNLSKKISLKNTLLSLAILKVNWDHLKKDYIENFVPFVATLLKKKNYQFIEVSEICNDFKVEFGLIIPRHPMITILNRCKKRGLIKQSEHEYIPVKRKITEFEFSRTSQEQIKKHEKVTLSFIDFANKEYNVALSKEAAESAIVFFLKEHDLEIMFGAEELALLPSVKSSKNHKFLINSFIRYIYKYELETFDYIKNIALGLILSAPLLYREFDRFKGKLEGLNIYIDTSFIFGFLGVQGKHRQTAYAELLSTLLEEGSNLYIFRHTYEEIMGILSNCLIWIENPKYNPSIASPALRYFYQCDFNQSDIDMFIIKVDSTLKKSKIEIKEAPNPNEYQIFQIDEEKLHEKIISTYKEVIPTFDEQEKVDGIRRDIKSISAISKLRREINPRSIKDAKYIFLTTNCSLAFANKKFEYSEGKNPLIIPSCLTDIFLGTIVWLQSPAKLHKVNEQKIIADCYAALQPSPLLLKRYLDKLEKLKSEGKINYDEYYMLRTHRSAHNLLEEKTMGDPNNFTDRTPQEILNQIKRSIHIEEERKYLEERERHKLTKEELISSKKKIKKIDTNLEKRAGQISNAIGWITFIIICALLIFGTLTQIFPNFFKVGTLFSRIFIIFAGLVAISGAILGLNFKGIKNKLKDGLKRKIIKYFK